MSIPFGICGKIGMADAIKQCQEACGDEVKKMAAQIQECLPN